MGYPKLEGVSRQPAECTIRITAAASDQRACKASAGVYRRFQSDGVCMSSFRVLRRLALVAAALAGTGAVQAGFVTVVVAPGSYVPGQTVSVLLQDTNPIDMCSGGLCAADIQLSFNPDLLAFSGNYTAGDLPSVLNPVAVGGPAASGSLAFSLIFDEYDPAALVLGSPTTVLSVDFTVVSGLGGQAVVTAEPDPAVSPASYTFGTAASLPVTVQPGTTPQVPEPGSLGLVLLALGLTAIGSRRARS